jgi:hypothetical protein
MAEISRVALFGKLNTLAYRSIEAATVLCKLRGNPYVELCHWMYQILQNEDSDVHRICRHFSVDAARLAADLAAALDRLPRGATSITDLSADIENAVERGWVDATLMFKWPCIRTGHLLAAMLRTRALASPLKALSHEFERIDAGQLNDAFDRIVEHSPEGGLGAQDGSRLVDHAAPARRDIFLSYRRADSIHIAGRVFDRLRSAIGADRVFKDVNSIPLGSNFLSEIQAEIGSARVMLVLMGPRWLTLSDDAGRRKIDDESDLVRIEIQWALDKGIPIIPLLFDGASMPSAASMPRALEAFASSQALQIRPDPGFDSDMDSLIAACRSYLTRHLVQPS